MPTFRPGNRCDDHSLSAHNDDWRRAMHGTTLTRIANDDCEYVSPHTMLREPPRAQRLRWRRDLEGADLAQTADDVRVSYVLLGELELTRKPCSPSRRSLGSGSGAARPPMLAARATRSLPPAHAHERRRYVCLTIRTRTPT